MTEEPKTNSANERVAHERCVCREVLEHLRTCFGVSPAVRDHLTNSRIELLKAIRAAIDERIETLSAPAQRGTKVAVE